MRSLWHSSGSWSRRCLRAPPLQNWIGPTATRKPAGHGSGVMALTGANPLAQLDDAAGGV